LHYRREIDGLRALAVVPVILFHAGFSLFSGGFVGVDVFFVISGYLITGILIGQLEQKRFSLLDFYERRARRILPALFVMMACTLPFAWAWMLPSQMDEFAGSLVSVVLFASNILFWHEQGYFAQAAELKPLLHTWSLAVEEQYYLLFPLILAGLWRFGRRAVIAVITLLALASLVASEWGWRYAPEANFYLAPFRAWELLAGSLCAFLMQGKPQPSSHALSLTGLLMIGYAILRFDEATPFPGINALLPVVGTALILVFAGPGSWGARLLGTRPLVGIGLISYSAYLWHQPLFAFARIRSIGAPSPALMAALALASLVLAVLSWRYVERPFRHAGAILPRRKTVFLASAFVGSLFLLLGGYVQANRAEIRSLWLSERAPQSAQAYRLFDAQNTFRSNVGTNAKGVQDFAPCRFNIARLTRESEQRITACRTRLGPGTLILGDSHAIDLFGMVATRFDTPFLIGITQVSCRPHSPRPPCQYDGVLRFVRQNPGVFGHVIYEQAGFYLMLAANGAKGSRAIIADVPMEQPVGPFALDREHIAGTLAYLRLLAREVPVTWWGPRVEPLFPFRQILEKGCAHPFRLRPGQTAVYDRLDAELARQVGADKRLRFVSQNRAIGYRFPEDLMTCKTLYWSDGDHLSIAGEERFAARLPADLLAPPHAQ